MTARQSNSSFFGYKNTSLGVIIMNKVSFAKFPICFNFQSASMLLKIGENLVCQKLVKILFVCQMAGIWVRRHVTRHLNRIQAAVCIRQSSCEKRAKD